MKIAFKKLTSNFFALYQNDLGIKSDFVFESKLEKATFSVEDFEYYLIASSLYSSKIEGNSLDADSFFRYRKSETSPKKREIKEIEDLVKAYLFAVSNPISLQNFYKAHGLLSQELLPKEEQGKPRKDQVGVRDKATMRPIYLAVEPEFVEKELAELFEDIQVLLDTKLTELEVFYFASLIHLWVAFIHPFGDGNGRAARLLEKWFLASKLGQVAWSISSEKYYWDHRPEYYQNIAIGYNYYLLHWERCIPFLKMLLNAGKVG